MKNAEMEMKKWMGMRVVTEVSLTVRERMRLRVVCGEMSMMFDEKEPSPGVRRLVEEISEYYEETRGKKRRQRHRYYKGFSKIWMGGEWSVEASVKHGQYILTLISKERRRDVVKSYESKTMRGEIYEGIYKDEEMCMSLRSVSLEV